KTLNRLETAVAKSAYVGAGKKLKVTNEVCRPFILLSLSLLSRRGERGHICNNFPNTRFLRLTLTSSVDSSSRSATEQSTAASRPASPSSTSSSLTPCKKRLYTPRTKKRNPLC